MLFLKKRNCSKVESYPVLFRQIQKYNYLKSRVYIDVSPAGGGGYPVFSE